MKFFFPDSQDQVDPGFDFISETHPPFRIRQRDDLYAHEVLHERPFDGLLISKAIIDGLGSTKKGQYNDSARNRLYREGARKFFRLDGVHSDVQILGDCGAFAYVDRWIPPYTIDEVIDFYEGCSLDIGIAPDHIIFGYSEVGKKNLPNTAQVGEWHRRQQVTLDNAREFMNRCERRRASFLPAAVAHGWNPESYARSVAMIVEMGFKFVALGGMIPLKTKQIIDCLDCVQSLIPSDCQLHLLGVTRVEFSRTFSSRGVTSFDSTSPFFQAFKDNRNNYYTPEENYVAIRVPQLDGNTNARKQIAAGRIGQRHALSLERDVLEGLRAYDKTGNGLEEVLLLLSQFIQLLGMEDRVEKDYRRTLTDKPWKSCRCGICDQIGIEVVLFRGSERNKRRGFHNLAVFRNHLYANRL